MIKDLSFDKSTLVYVDDWHEGHSFVTVCWRKERGKLTRKETFLADRDLRAGALLRRLRDATAATRRAAAVELQEFPWICVDQVDMKFASADRKQSALRVASDGNSLLMLRPVFEVKCSSFMSFRDWCYRTRKQGLQIELPEQYTRNDDRVALSYRALRPAAKWARRGAKGYDKLLLELVDDNSINVLAAHYTNMLTATLDAADSWRDITDIAMEVATGLRPTALNAEGEVVSGPAVTREQAQAALRGEIRVGMSSCRDPLQSPLDGESAGRICGSANRSCYFCPNSIVTPNEIPFLKAFLVLAEQAAVHMAAPEWRWHWGRTVEWINYVMPKMDPNWLDTPIAQPGIFNLGLEASPA